MPAIQSLGVGSGLDANSIVTQLLAIERQPLIRLQKNATGIQSEISAFGNLASKADALDAAADRLASASTWSATKAVSADSSAITVTASDSADPVALDIQITTLAKAQSVSTVAGAFASSSALVNTAQDLTVEIGEWVAGNLVTTGSTTVQLAATDTLEGARDKINAASAGVTATILNDGSGARLVLRATSTGVENAFKITSTAGGSPFSFTNPLTFDQTAVDLSATVNGATVTSSSNTLTNLVDGVSVTALKATTSPVAVSVSKDLEGMKSKISAFVSAYNDLIGYARQQTAYNESTKASATLQGDRLAVGLQSQLRASALDSTAASSVYGRLSAVGIDLQRDGTLTINASTLDASLEDLNEVSKLFSRDDALSTNDGIAVRLSDFIEGLTGTDGTLTSKQAALRERLTRNQKDQERMTDRLAVVEARLKAQYAALDEKMASLSGLSSYVSQQVQLLNRSSGG